METLVGPDNTTRFKRLTSGCNCYMLSWQACVKRFAVQVWLTMASLRRRKSSDWCWARHWVNQQGALWSALTPQSSRSRTEETVSVSNRVQDKWWEKMVKKGLVLKKILVSKHDFCSWNGGKARRGKLYETVKTAYYRKIEYWDYVLCDRIQ